MGLQNWEWALRVGIPPNYLDQTSSPPQAISYIGQLILWRWEELMPAKKKTDWQHDVSRFGSGKSADKVFWRELSQKKVGLYGYSVSTSADPIALARHPWSLKKNEFDSALSSVQDGNVPTIPDDREHVSAVLAIISGVSAVGAAGAASTVVGAPAAPVLATISGLSGGAAAIVAGASDRVDVAHGRAFQAHIKQFRDIYIREADYRKREVG